MYHQHTLLAAKARSEARSISTFDILQQYLEIKDYINEIGSEDFDVFRLLPVEDRKAEALLEKLKRIKSIRKQL